MSNEVVNGLGEISTAIGNYLIPLAAASGLTVALLEAAKKLFSIRGNFHRRAVARWLAEQHDKVATMKFDPLTFIHGVSQYDVKGDSLTAAKASKALVDVLDARSSAAFVLPDYSADEAYRELKLLTTGVRQGADVKVDAPRSGSFRSIERALFELELPRMMSQIQDAADAVLQNPKSSPHLYLFLTRGCDPTDVASWSQHMYQRPAQPDPQRQATIAELYGRIRLLVRRQLDSFQTITSFRWEELNQLWAVVVGAVVLYVAQCVGGEAGIRAIAYSLLGGVLAPVTKDVLSAISNIKLGRS